MQDLNGLIPTPDTLKSERESLERIHTFCLKESSTVDGDVETRSRGVSASSRDSSVMSNKSCS